MENFTRRVENFCCEVCRASVVGDGYTNHCPVCLYSKHVDKVPGDRGSRCRGLMRPVAVLKRGKDLVLTHRCLSCGIEKVNRTDENDHFEAVLAIMRGEETAPQRSS